MTEPLKIEVELIANSALEIESFNDFYFRREEDNYSVVLRNDNAFSTHQSEKAKWNIGLIKVGTQQHFYWFALETAQFLFKDLDAHSKAKFIQQLTKSKND